jgi:hypothetical protein
LSKTSRQSASLAESVRETARFATAMEAVASSLKETAQASAETLRGLRQQMRAYLSVGVGGAVYQDRTKQLRFEAKSVLTNSGLTPAHKVKHRTSARIMPIPIAPDFTYPLPAGDSGENLVGPRQTAVLSVIVDDFVPDADVDDIKVGKGKALVVWGIVEYDDVFGDQQDTRFCQILTWLQDGTVWGYFAPGHNDGT